MDPMIARAVIALRLTPSGPEKLDALRDYEKSLNLPLGRYLQGFEIMRWLNRMWPELKIENPSEQEMQRLGSLWFKYENMKLKTEAMATPKIAHDWEDWVIENLNE